MSKQIENIAIVLKPSTFDDLPNIVTNLIRWFSRRGKKLYFHRREIKRLEGKIPEKTLNQVEFVESSYLFHKVDLLISMGGDGTLLGVARRVNSKVPVFSVNIGRLGFITEFEKTEFYEKINVVLMGKFETFKKNLYSVEVSRQNEKSIKKYFFNDAVFTKNDLARMFTLSIESDQEHIYNISGDGLIISSTYGSTAYSLAAGGPIVHPDVKALILTPICAHSLTHRPLVIPDSQVLNISILEKINSINITLDGQDIISIH
jgi:NAD+ kinase